MPVDAQHLTCPVTGWPYLLQDTPAGEPPLRLMVFLDGLGLDGRSYHTFLGARLQTRRLPGSPCASSVVVVPTLPGFGPGQGAPDTPLIDMGAQVDGLDDFLLNLSHAYPGVKLTLYGFSYGGDLVLECLHRWATRKPAFPIERVVSTEPNVQRSSCFFSARIVEAYETWRRNPRAHDNPPAVFRKLVLRPLAEGRLSREMADDLTAYCKAIETREWRQLSALAREASADPAQRVRRALRAMHALPDLAVDLILSEPSDHEALLDLVAESGRPATLNVPPPAQRPHFYHVGPEGIRRNLTCSAVALD